MKTLASLFGLLLPILLAGGLFLWYSLMKAPDLYTVNERVAGVISTPKGLVQAETVRRVSWEHDHGWLTVPQARGIRSKVQGEALVFSLPDGHLLFALLGNDSEMLGEANQDVYESIDRSGPTEQWYWRWMRALSMQRDPRPVPPNYYPRLVTFTDITDPASVALVDPGDLAASFGPGYALERITVQITDAPVTEGVVEGVLGCLNSAKACIPLNTTYPYGHPMRNILNSDFRRIKR